MEVSLDNIAYWFVEGSKSFANVFIPEERRGFAERVSTLTPQTWVKIAIIAIAAGCFASLGGQDFGTLTSVVMFAIGLGYEARSGIERVAGGVGNFFGFN